MNPIVQAILGTQWGLITRRQATEAGLSEDQLRTLIRRGSWVAVRRGVYAEKDHWDELDQWTGRPLLRVRAAHLRMRRDHVMSHDSAALLQGMPILLGDPELVHVTRRGVAGSRTEHGVKHHTATFTADEVVEIEGIRCLDPARTAVDIAREHGPDRGTVACDSAMRMGVSRAQLEATCARMWCWPGSTHARDAVALADPGAESVGESLGRRLVHELGIGRPQTQFELRDATRQVFCDMRVGRHIFEFDGRVKYLPRDAGGVADKPVEDVLWEEKTRQDWVCGFKLGLSRIVWADLWGERRKVARGRLAREYASTVERYGTSIDDLRRPAA